jgi:hypothetical protein
MGYSADPQMVRVDFFKPGPSFKWYTTEAIRWKHYFTNPKDGGVILIQDAFKVALIEHLGHGLKMRLRGLIAVCLEPYHEAAHPLMISIPEDGFLVYTEPKKDA